METSSPLERGANLGGDRASSYPGSSSISAWLELVVIRVYYLTCIYNSQRIWSTNRHYWPDRAWNIARYEQTFGVTVSRKKIDVIDLGSAVAPIHISDIEALEQVSKSYILPIFVPEGQRWALAGGAFGQRPVVLINLC